MPKTMLNTPQNKILQVLGFTAPYSDKPAGYAQVLR